MKFVNALALTLGVIGAVLAFLALGPASGVYFIWAVFIATAMGVALGGTTEAFKNLVVCGALGVVLAWIASLLILNIPVPLPGPLWPAIVVGATTALMPLAAHLKPFPAIPATVVGYASTFAYLLSAGKLNNDTLLSLSFANPLLVNVISILVAAAFGVVSLHLSTRLSKPASA